MTNALMVIEFKKTKVSLPPAYYYACQFCNYKGFGARAMHHLETKHGFTNSQADDELLKAASGPECPKCGVPSLRFKSSMAAPGVGSFYVCGGCGASITKIGRSYIPSDDVDPEALCPDYC